MNFLWLGLDFRNFFYYVGWKKTASKKTCINSNQFKKKKKQSNYLSVVRKIIICDAQLYITSLYCDVHVICWIIFFLREYWSVLYRWQFSDKAILEQQELRIQKGCCIECCFWFSLLYKIMFENKICHQSADL